jgi:glycosyltransferase involved in cell wall biosynthesis
MNPHKICFITCVTDEEMYQESLLYINHLIIPDGFEIEIIEIKDAACITKAYNSAMQSSDAKYKVYLHQDVFIVNKNFITDIVDLFLKYPNTGMFGVVGSAQISTTGVWWESKQNYGKVYDSHTGQMQLLAFHEVNEEYQSVQAIDGLIMITQYDIPWRDDIFTGWHFYDLSQSMEFIRAGYQVGIPLQVEPWCVHDSGVANTSNGYEVYREVFLDEYSKDGFPLVSIIIPTHNRLELFKIALESAMNQTYKNIEIIVADSSDDEVTKNFMQFFVSNRDNISYIFHKGLPGADNWLSGFSQAKGDYLNLLPDDDVFHTDKIRKAMEYYLQYPEINLVLAPRQIIDINGNHLQPFAAAIPLFDHDTIIEGKAVAKIILINLMNVAGEHTLFKRKYVDLSLLNVKEGASPILDVIWNLQALLNGKCVYIRDALSSLRVHSGQGQFSKAVIQIGILEWYRLIMKSYHNKSVYDTTEEYCQSMKNWIKMVADNIIFFNREDLKFVDVLLGQINDSIKNIINCKYMESNEDLH